MAPRFRPPRQQRSTLLLVVEGETEKAFCDYLKSMLSRNRNISVTILNAYGGSPEAIVEYADRQCKTVDFDRVMILMDVDKPVQNQLMFDRQIHEMHAELLFSRPCIEGELLEALGMGPTPATSTACKAKFHQTVIRREDATKPASYARHFPIERLELLRTGVSVLSRLIRAIGNM